MKPVIQTIVEDLPLRDYQPQYGDVCMKVWVNPPKNLTDQRIQHLAKAGRLKIELDTFMSLNIDGGAESVDQAKARMEEVVQEMTALSIEMIAWLSEIWSQGPEETRMTSDELTEFVKECDENDPMLYAWLVERTVEMIQDYRRKKKKA